MSKDLYKLYCVDESRVVEVWTDIPPTECPNSSVHTIDLDSVRPSTQYKDVFLAAENSDGYFETTHIEMNVPSGTPGDITEHDVSWPMNILLWMTLLTPTADMIGDLITVLAAPETIVGVVGALVNIGDTVLTVNSTVLENTMRGFLITIDDGVNKDVVGRCINIDGNTSTITVDTPTTYSFAPGTPVKISIYLLKGIYISDSNVIGIGSKGFKGKQVPAGTILRVYYTNNSGTAKTFRWRPEYYNLG